MSEILPFGFTPIPKEAVSNSAPATGGLASSISGNCVWLYQRITGRGISSATSPTVPGHTHTGGEDGPYIKRWIGCIPQVVQASLFAKTITSSTYGSFTTDNADIFFVGPPGLASVSVKMCLTVSAAGGGYPTLKISASTGIFETVLTAVTRAWVSLGNVNVSPGQINNWKLFLKSDNSHATTVTVHGIAIDEVTV